MDKHNIGKRREKLHRIKRSYKTSVPCENRSGELSNSQTPLYFILRFKDQIAQTKNK